MYSFWLCGKLEHMDYYFKQGLYPTTLSCTRLSPVALFFFSHCFAPLSPSPWPTGSAEKANRCTQYVFYQVAISIPLAFSAVMIPRHCASCSIFRSTTFSVQPRAQCWPCNLGNLKIKSRPQSAERAVRLLGR